MVKGIYLHIPFCSYKCPYCDFLSFVEPQASHEEYLQLLLKELDLYKDLDFSLKTLYFGGGTPSLIKPKLYEDFIRKLSKGIDLSCLEEISLEANPENYSFEEYKQLKGMGFNRISIGAQSLREEGLKVLGRLHSVGDTLRAVYNAHRAGFENINIDLIYGYQGQSLRDLEKEIDLLKNLPLTHISLYLLTPYEDTQIGNLYKKGLLKLPDEDTIGDMYQLLVDKLSDMGFLHYEVSNFALEGYECKHNLLYWTHEEFLGLGPSAWSFVKYRRFGNTRNLRLYKEGVLKGKKPVEYEEVLEGKEKIYDYIFVVLRTRKGVEKDLLPYLPEDLKEFFEEEKGRLRLNTRGMLLINEILLRLKGCIRHW
ncbi:MAG: radical SAM family heme chaperone HemW [Aquificaceae bacterium]